MHARLCGPKTVSTLYQIILRPDFPSLADDIAEPSPNMNIKVAAFTVSQKSYNIQALKALIIVCDSECLSIHSQLALVINIQTHGLAQL